MEGRVTMLGRLCPLAFLHTSSPQLCGGVRSSCHIHALFFVSFLPRKSCSSSVRSMALGDIRVFPEAATVFLSP